MSVNPPKPDSKTSSTPFGQDEDLIAALSSGNLPSGVAVIRISGTECLTKLAPCFKGKNPETWPERHAQLVHFVDPVPGELVDQVLAIKFVGPHSFTGQDVIEIHCHGGPYIVQRILRTLYQSGCRPAEPGEYTKRAFLSGKLDLSEAEGFRELIEATSHQQWRAARYLASGRLSEKIESLRSELIDASAYLEARIDFPDEGDTSDVTLDDALVRVRKAHLGATQLLASYDSGRVASEGMRVVFVGEPNAGKSTLLNELLGEERAIVTEIAGTTRDYIESACLVNGRLIKVVDTAGVREATDQVERLGVETTLRLARNADLVVFLIPNGTSLTDESAFLDAIRSEVSPRDELILQTKADLGPVSATNGRLRVSAKSGHGMSALRDALSSKVDRWIAPLKESDFVTNARHKQALDKCVDALERFFHEHGAGQYDECLAYELQEATRALSSIIGRVDSEDILDRIFSTFCVGK